MGKSIADVRWGHDKERLPLEQTTEVVVYSLTSHMPSTAELFEATCRVPEALTLYPRTLTMPAPRICFSSPTRGHDTLRDLEKYILRGQRMIMCVKTSQKEVTGMIRWARRLWRRLGGMDVDPDAKLHHKQNDVGYAVEGKRAAVKTANPIEAEPVFRSCPQSQGID
ncbi:MAG: hypothetical protein LBP92_02420 [Deltaproteobacteria bacterium]|nr:hypothetical protein [Deltaproteobacteria bacterium]